MDVVDDACSFNAQVRTGSARLNLIAGTHTIICNKVELEFPYFWTKYPFGNP